VEAFGSTLIMATQANGPATKEQIDSIMRIEKALAGELTKMSNGPTPPTLYESGAAFLMLMGTWLELCEGAAKQAAEQHARNAANN